MFSSQQFYPRLAVAALSITTLSHVVTAQSIPVAYCATLNTATNQNGNASIYQSEGLCYNFCLSDYAFAVLSGNQCWCSNYVPGSGTTSSNDCSGACVGYPGDWCGDDTKGLFGYIALAKSPSGTQGSGSTATTSRRSSQSQDTVVPAEPSTPAIPISTIPFSSLTSSTSTSQSTSTSATSTQSTTSSTSSSATWTPTPIVSVETVSGGGGYRTVTVTPTAPAAATSGSDLSQANSGGGGLSTGGAVGLTVGLVALAAIIGAIAFCCIRRRRKQASVAAAAAYEEHNTPRGSSAGGIPTRTMSENSRYMLGTDGHQRVVEAWQDENAGSRASRLMPVDPRLDPFAPVYQRGDASKSRESVATIEDGHDYSRRMVGRGKGPLRAINVDE